MSGIDPDLAGHLAARLDAASQVRLGRSLALFPVTAGDCGGCTLEWALLHTLAQHGLHIADDPAEADVLIVMGAITRSLVVPIQRALAAMAEPRWVVAIGDCAIDGGLFAPSGAIAGGADAAVPVDLAVPGCPPTPTTMLAALRTLIEANA